MALDQEHSSAWYNLGNALRDQKDLPTAADAYERALAIDPRLTGAWNNLGVVRRDQKKLSEAIAAFQRALAIDPKHSSAWNNLGTVLRDQKKTSEALEAHRKAVASDPNDALAWINLGNVLSDQKDMPAAIDAWRKGLAIQPKHALVWYDLGLALYYQKDLPAAVDACKKSLAINPRYALAWNNLGIALHDQQDLVGAVAAYRNAIQTDPSYANAHAGLGLVHRDRGDFVDAVAALRHALDLLPKGDALRTFVERNLTQCQALLALEQRLPSALKPEKLSSADYLALADLCQRYKKRYRAAAELYAKSFAAEPKTAENLAKGYRYDAACFAALAAAGQGVGAADLGEQEKSRLRQQALAWLKADLAARGKLLEQNPQAGGQVQKEMQHWKKDSDLAGVRDKAELAKLPDAERKQWQALWDDVASLLRRVSNRQ